MYKQIIELDVVFMFNEVAWVVQCLNHDIAAQGSTVEEAKKNFEHTFLGQLQITPFQDILPPTKDSECWQYPRTKLFLSVESTFAWE